MSGHHRPKDGAVARGCLLGAACGDALGAPFEGSVRVPARVVRAWAQSSEPFRFTDDTAMTVVLARHLVATRGDVHEDLLVHEFARAWKEEPHRGYGTGPPQIFRAVLAGQEWSAVARDSFGGTGSWGNGGAMRVAPVALLPSSLNTRTALARRQAGITHAHPLAQDGAALQCAAVAEAAATSGEALELAEFLARLDGQLLTPEFRRSLHVVGEVVHAGSAAGIASALGTDISALGSVPGAIALFLRWPDDAEKAMATAVEVGGDTDTVASMVGALAGARVGDTGLPTGWVDRLEDADELAAVADALGSLRSG